MERLIVLDTETTGLSPSGGHRIVEIGCVELIEMRKGETRQWYIHPERDIPAEATRIHGITNEKVATAPRFADMADDFLNFIGDDTLVIHNAAFDRGFLNAELVMVQRKLLDVDRVIDTIPIARRKFPGASASLDALCKRLKVDNSHRTLHGALLDADLLADVYVELLGGNQFSLDFSGQDPETPGTHEKRAVPALQVHPMRTWTVPEADRQRHQAFLERLQRESNACIWLSDASLSVGETPQQCST